MPEDRFPIYREFVGSPDAPREVWTLHTLGPEESRPVHRLCAWIDETAWGAQVVRADARPQVAALADGIARARKGMNVGLMPGLLDERATIATIAYALVAEVEAWLNPYPPTVVTGTEAAPAGMLRMQMALPANADLDRPWTAFPLDFLSAPYVNAWESVPAAQAARVTDVDAGNRFPVVAQSPKPDGIAGTHLLIAGLAGPDGGPKGATQCFAATLPAETRALAEIDAWAEAALAAGAFGGFLHPLGALAWDNVRRTETWDLVGRAHAALPRIALEGGQTVIDLSAAPSRIERVGGTPLAAAAVMWLGPAMVAALGGSDRVAAFADCAENRALPGGARRILLEHPLLGMTERLARRQAAFRREILSGAGARASRA